MFSIGVVYRHYISLVSIVNSKKRRANIGPGSSLTPAIRRYNRVVAALGEPVLMTVEQFHALPERGDVLEELQWGHVTTLSRPKPWHVKLQIRIADLLRLRAGERGYVITELPFRAVREYDLRAADVAFVSRERWDQAGESDLAGAPEIVVEILSPSNTKSQLREYAALCLANGCEEFWSVNREERSVTVIAKQGRSVRYNKGQAIPIAALNGQTLPVDEIFPEATK